MTRGLNRLYFHLLRRGALLLFVCLLLVVAPGRAIAAVPLMPVEEIQVGAHGIARTVIAGTRIEEFGIEVLGIMKNKGAVGDLILIRTYGDVIDRSGGVAQGMSGSPVFIDGRLIGAIGYGWTLTDQRTAMVTPIHDMLKLLDRLPEKSPEITAEPKDDLSGADKTLIPAKPSTALKALLSTPLMATGFGENALSYLQMKLKPLKLTPYEVGDPPSDIAYGALEPGSAVGVQLVRGDVSLGALGTVTYVDGDKMLAFGHPFLKRGKAGYLMTNAYIFTTIRGIESSFKVGTTGGTIGTISQDRGAGIAGEMNQYPGIVPMRMTIRSSDSDQPREMAVQLVQDEEIVPVLATASLLSAIEKSIDRIGSGTARITFEIAARGMPGETYKRENMFYSPENVAEGALAEFYEFIAFLTSNPHNPVTLMDIQTEVSVSPERRTARILSAQPLQLSAKPGETVDIEVKLKPFRSEPITRTVRFTIPKEQETGALNLNVRGGGFFSIASLLKKLGLEGEIPKPTRKPVKSFEAMMKEFSSRDRNNDIVVEMPGGADLSEEELGGEKKPKLKLTESEKAVTDTKPKKREKAEKPEKQTKEKPSTSILTSQKPEHKIKGFLTTDYIIEGDTDVSIEISKNQKP